MAKQFIIRKNHSALWLLCVGLWLIACKAPRLRQKPATGQASIQQQAKDSSGTDLLKTEGLVIKKLSPQVYLHTSFLTTTSFGRVDCNGMVVATGGEAIVFDTPADEESATALINYVVTQLNCKIIAVIPTHFHEDCLGGLEAFLQHNIPAYALDKTIVLLKEKARSFSKPIQPFKDSLALSAGGKTVHAGFYGEGHTKDNIVGYFAEGGALFGGCLIKAAGAGSGNLEDANLAAWPATVRRVKQRYPQARVVIPGHGKWGDTALLDYTVSLFE